MKPVNRVEGRAIPFGQKNVDTDVIIPAKWLKTVSRDGLGEGAFEAIRAQEGNIFDDPEYAGANILIAGDNFGCGSSREHAAWALADLGITAVIAPSFSDIFSGNAFKNGLLAIAVPQAAVDRLMEVAKTDPITIDMESMSITTPFQDRFTFEMDPFRHRCLVEGLDEIDLTLAKSDAIERHEKRSDSSQPWLIPAVA
ncbi:3-isopropylmalate dehydratase small subunit [Parasphingorhabdus sp.]|uniref:3-isopropylmalate dehydratase small subunit n=1 Tax=Parasphingorhabdus sp. TaxID=2709688 RepID=UPI003A908F20